jgi:hypothetical protein
MKPSVTARPLVLLPSWHPERGTVSSLISTWHDNLYSDIHNEKEVGSECRCSYRVEAASTDVDGTGEGGGGTQWLYGLG